MPLIPIAQRLADIEARGIRLKRRIEKITSDRDFLVDDLITRPVADMSAQRRLLDEWNEEIRKSEHDLEELRKEWTRLSNIKSHKKQTV